MKFDTKLIHAGHKICPETKAVVEPIVTSVSFEIENPGGEAKYDYSRVSTPTRAALERALASLENAKYAFAFSSGCAATRMVMELLKKGDLLLAEEDLYGGSRRLFTHIEEAQGVRVKYLDFSNEEEVKEALKEKPRMIWIETPTNPLLKIVDIEKVAHLKKKDTLLCVDNTFASPLFQNPLNLGADIVIHSATKYLGGHSDCLSGAIMFSDDKLKEKMDFLNKSIGSCLSPFDSYLLLRSLKTLSVRMKRQEETSLKLSEFLLSHKKVDTVFYPGLPSHKGYDIAKKQMSGFSGVLSFEIKGGQKEAISFLKALKVFTLAESLGAVESLAEHPKTMTHGIYGSQSVTDNLIRLSLGLEDFEDLKEDLKRAFGEV